MKRALFAAVCFSFLLSLSYGQTCLSGGVVFSNQAQIDNFNTDHPGCTVIQGDVRIVGNDITNIDSLSKITSIEGNLLIDLNPQLTDVDGFMNLVSVDGYVRFFDNDALISLAGLDKLETIGGFLSFERNDGLEELNGLNALQEVSEYILIRFSDNLKTIGGLNALTKVGGLLVIRDNPIIENLDGLDNLNTIDTSLWIFTNDSLNDISALSNLSSIGKDIIIQRNDNLPNLNGLQGISSLVGNLDIQGNNGLMNLTGLDNLETIGGYLYFNNNSPLEDLSELQNLKSVGDFLGVDYHTTLKSLSGLENLETIGGALAFNVNDVLEDLSALSNVTTIAGELILDSLFSLQTLDGLENIDPTSITALNITNSPLLTDCAIRSVCVYLDDPNNTSSTIVDNIQNNAQGCDTEQDVINNCFQAGEIPVTFQLSNRLTFGDPCNCNDPLNCQEPGGLFLFHDKLRIPETGTIATGLDIRINTATDIYLDVSCNGGTLTSAMNGDQIPETSPGVYEIEFWRPSGVQPTLSVIENSMITTAPAATFQPICDVASCGSLVSVEELSVFDLQKRLGFVFLLMFFASFLIVYMPKTGH